MWEGPDYWEGSPPPREGGSGCYKKAAMGSKSVSSVVSVSAPVAASSSCPEFLTDCRGQAEINPFFPRLLLVMDTNAGLADRHAWPYGNPCVGFQIPE